jgi:hypothetical protein
MFLAFLGCFGFFLLYIVYLSLQIPFEFCILSPHLWKWKTVIYEYYHLFSPYNIEITLIFLLQLALIKGIANRAKEDESGVVQG